MTDIFEQTGRTSETFRTAATAGDNSSGFDRTMGYVGSGIDAVGNGLSLAWDGVKGAVHSPEINPLMMGVGALFAGILAWKFVPMLLQSSLSPISDDRLPSRLLRGTISLAAVGGVAIAAASGIGELRDDPAPRAPTAIESTPATHDPRLAVPGQ